METFLQPSSHVALLASVDDETGIETSLILDNTLKDRRMHLIVMIVDMQFKQDYPSELYLYFYPTTTCFKRSTK